MAICAKFPGYTSSMHPLAIARSTTVLVEPLVTCIIVFYHLIESAGGSPDRTKSNSGSPDRIESNSGSPTRIESNSDSACRSQACERPQAVIQTLFLILSRQKIF